MTSHASTGTDCAFGGPTPGWSAIKLDLPQGTSFLTLELAGLRTLRPVHDDDNWHLAQGIFVLNATTREVEAYRISSQGMSPRKVVARAEGVPATAPDAAATTPDVPYAHSAHGLRDSLSAGSYYVIAFGTDGGSGLPNEWWSAGVQVSASASCARIGAGETFDIDHTDFEGGTEMYVPVAGYAEGIGARYSTTRRVVVALMDAETQARGASSVTLEYTTPTASGSLSQRIEPLASGAGSYTFGASFSGVYPIVLIAGAAIDLP